MAESAILFDSSRCSACKGCQVACKCWNLLPSPMEKDVLGFTGSYQSPLDLNGDTRLLISFHEEKGGKNGVEWAFGRRSCMHCIDPACVSVCPTGTLSVDEASGFVVVHEENCIGCKYCSAACPFSVPHYHGSKSKVNKCTACIDRIEQGLTPACVKTCPPKALRFGDRNEMIALAEAKVAMLKTKGYDKAAVYGVNELSGLHVITVAKYGPEAYGLPIDPKVSSVVGMLAFMKPLAGIGAAAIVAGLGLSFLTGLGYKRHEMHYDEKTHEIIDMETGEVVRHLDDEKEV